MRGQDDAHAPAPPRSPSARRGNPVGPAGPGWRAVRRAGAAPDAWRARSRGSPDRAAHRTACRPSERAGARATRGDPPPDRVPRRIQLRAEPQHLRHGEAVERHLLGDEPHPPEELAAALRGETRACGPARAGLEQAGRQMQKRGLAGPVRSDQGDHRAVGSDNEQSRRAQSHRSDWRGTWLERRAPRSRRPRNAADAPIPRTAPRCLVVESRVERALSQRSSAPAQGARSGGDGGRPAV